MSKPPHKLDLPSLDELFDDTFERNARRVLHAATGLEQKYGEIQPLAEPGNEPGRELAEPVNHRNVRSRKRRSSWLHADVGPVAGLFLIGVGLIAISFAVTLFVLNLNEPNARLQAYVWPTGLIGQLALLLGFGLRIGTRGRQLTSRSEHPAEEPRLRRSTSRKIRWDESHAPSSRSQPQRVGKA